MELPASWRFALGDETGRPYFVALRAFVAQARAEGPVFPPENEVFAALEHTPFDSVKVLLLGQDPVRGEVRAGGEDDRELEQGRESDQGERDLPGGGPRRRTHHFAHVRTPFAREGRGADKRDGPRAPGRGRRREGEENHP
jgi:hypothetical protein